MPRGRKGAHQAHARRPRDALATIPEASERSESDCECSEASSDRDDERAERAAVEWEHAPRSVGERPADQEVYGRVTLRGSADPQAHSMRAVCRIREGVLTLGTEQRTAAGDTTEKVVAEAPVEALAMCLRQGRFDVFTLATVDKDELFDEIYCFCGDSATRFEWIREFLRLGIPIHDYRN